MKRQIRRSVYETNSSSQHSISIMKRDEHFTNDEIKDDIYLCKDGVWNIYEDNLQYQRSPFKCLGTFANKWYYCLAALCGEYKDDIWNQFEEIAYEYIPGLTKIVLPTITRSERVYKEDNHDYGYGKGKTEDELVEMLMDKEEQFNYDFELNYWTNSENDYWYYQYPDTGYAEDYGMLKKFLEEKNISLEEFLTNKKYIIIVDGDEYCIWEDLKDTGLININDIEYEYPEVSNYEETD